MKFGRIATDQAAGAVIAHSLRVMGRKWKKGRLLSRYDVDVLLEEGVDTVVAARLESDDVDEDAAAEALARTLAGEGIEIRPAATGRCNLYSTCKGLLELRTEHINRINLVDEAFTVAVLPPYATVYEGQLVVSVKIIPFAVSREQLNACITVAAMGFAPVNIYPFKIKRIGLLQTRTAWFNSALLTKGYSMLEQRARALGSEIVINDVCDHDESSIAVSLKALLKKNLDLIFILGATAIQDRGDVIPQAIADCGGNIEHFGMPMDPGNLLLLAHRRQTTILGLPGCVRSPKRNGFDFVFERIAAGSRVTREDIMRMGVGGVLTEPSRRPQRRTGAPEAAVSDSENKTIAAVVLAAGQSRRMGSENKLLRKIGHDSVVRMVVRDVAASKVDHMIVATGHEQEKVVAELAGFKISVSHNADFSSGLSTSLRTALAKVPADCHAVLICLGDMPFIGSALIDSLIDAFDPRAQQNICVPTYRGKRGNPVLWDRRYIQEMMEVRGDVGAKHMIGDYEEFVIEVVTHNAGVLTDLDTPQAFAQAAESNSGPIED